MFLLFAAWIYFVTMILNPWVYVNYGLTMAVAVLFSTNLTVGITTGWFESWRYYKLKGEQ